MILQWIRGTLARLRAKLSLQALQSRMHREDFGRNAIFRPRPASELHVRLQAEDHMRSRFAVGRYEGAEKVNPILQHQYEFFSEMLTTRIALIALEDFLDFVLHQYDQSTAINQDTMNGRLSKAETERWQHVGPRFRRVAKYLAEKACSLQSTGTLRLHPSETMDILDEVWIAAESCVEFAMLSEQTHGLFPDETHLEIYQQGEQVYWEHGVKHAFRLEPDFALWRQHSKAIYGREPITYDFDWLNVRLGPGLVHDHGFDLRQAVTMLSWIIQGGLVEPGKLGIPFLLEDGVYNSLGEQLDLRPSAVRKAVSAFIVTKDAMDVEGRELYKPKQEYRLSRRGFLRMSHSLGPHIIYSKQMATECLYAFIEGFAFRNIPPEWNGTATKAASDKLSNELGDWFEGAGKDVLANEGIRGDVRFKKAIGKGSAKIEIPPDVGELDFLGVLPDGHGVVLGEFKMTFCGTEPRYFRDDLSKFTEGPKCYAAKFRKKIQWVVDNFSDVVKALKSIGLLQDNATPQVLLPIMFTYGPSVAKYLIEDFPCRMLTEFVVDLRRGGTWPYKTGVRTCL